MGRGVPVFPCASLCTEKGFRKTCVWPSGVTSSQMCTFFFHVHIQIRVLSAWFPVAIRVPRPPAAVVLNFPVAGLSGCCSVNKHLTITGADQRACGIPEAFLQNLAAGHLRSAQQIRGKCNTITAGDTEKLCDRVSFIKQGIPPATQTHTADTVPLFSLPARKLRDRVRTSHKPLGPPVIFWMLNTHLVANLISCWVLFSQFPSLLPPTSCFVYLICGQWNCVFG